MPQTDEIDFESRETCPNCGAFVGDNSLCENCGAVIFNEDELGEVEEDDDVSSDA